MSKTKTKKFRGSRTCGGGTTKNRRGAGNRGGRGRAGGCKHHNVRAMQLGYAYGKHGLLLQPVNFPHLHAIRSKVPADHVLK
jgi:ribosomal protein L15